jgi:hypothetical protein
MKTILNFIKCHARFLISIVVGLLITIFSNQAIIVDIFVWSLIATINAFISLISQYADSIGFLVWLIIFSSCGFITFGMFTMCKSESRKTMEYYVPTQVIRSYDRITLICKFKTIESNSLIIYNNKNPLICKDNKWNSFGNKMADIWYVCIK